MATGREDVVGDVGRLMKQLGGDETEPRPRVTKRVSKKSTRNTMLSQSVQVPQGRGVL